MGMRAHSIVWFMFAIATVAVAQQSPPSPAPPPVPPADKAYTPSPLPPPLPDVASDPEVEPQITIIRKETETQEEVRVNGELRYVKVTPKYGPSYYLIPRGNGQSFLRSDSLDFGLRTPMWLLFSW